MIQLNLILINIQYYMADKKWYVIYSKPRWEKKIDAALVNKGIESWCPIQKIKKQWTDRKKIIDEPIFRSYVFVHIEEAEKYEVLITPGVLNFVHYLGKPAEVRIEEIELMKKFLLEKDAKFEVISTEGFRQNTKVRVSHGVFIDKEGTVLRDGKKKVYVQIESLGQLMVVEFKTDYLIPISQN
jgi:transcription antitermination factor NusG